MKQGRQRIRETPVSLAPAIGSILVIAMTRMGDLFQLAPMASALREKHPGSRIGLVAYKEFGETAAGLSLFDDLFLVDGRAIRQMVYDDRISWSEKIERIRTMTSDWNVRDYDLLINLTPNRIGTVIGYLVRAREVRGVVMTGDGFRAFYDPAIAYFGMMVRNRLYNDSNLVDLFLRIARVPPPRRLVLRERMEPAGPNLPPGRRWIAVQTGASVALKRWPEESFVRMIAHFLSRSPGSGVVLVGAGEEDVARNRRIVAALEDRWSSGRILNLTGQTSVRELAGLLRVVSRLVSNDTGAMHVAAAMGTPVVALSFANLFYPETAPYGENHMVLQSRKSCAPCGIDAQCLNPVCRQDIDPEWLAQLLAYLEESPPGKESFREVVEGFLASHSPGPQLMVAVSGWDGQGRLRYRPVSRPPMGLPDLFRSLYRQVWGMEQEGLLLDWGTESDILSEDYEILSLPRHLWEDLRNAHLELGGLFREGESLCRMIRDRVEEGIPGEVERTELEERTRELEFLDVRIQELGWVAPTAGPISTLFEIEKEAVAIEDPMRLSEMIRGVEQVYRASLSRNERLIRLADRWFSSLAPGRVSSREREKIQVPVP
ncbi:MAG: glycosyltransferase family 9 protein [Nitrospiraceae bacterium]|nr:glycosyltransferase family 9 protein [Nitrospiraceae bacterium]